MNATERTHLVIDSAAADADDAIVSSRRSLLGTGVLGAGVLGAAIALGVGQQASATTAPLSAEDALRSPDVRDRPRARSA